MHLVTAFSLLLILLWIRHRRHQSRREIFLTGLFKPGSEFIGKDIDYLISKAGPYTMYGSMDHGQDVAQWRVGQLLLEAWFKNGLCEGIEIRPHGRVRISTK